MVDPVRKLIIAVFAVLAFLAGNVAMVSSGMEHEVGFSDQHVAAIACATDHARHGALELAEEHPCQPVQKGACDSGPSCCTGACQALVTSSSVVPFRANIEVLKAWVATPEAVNPVILLERPPRRWASA